MLVYAQIGRSRFYYKSKTGKRGRKPYASIVNQLGQRISEQTVIEKIKQLFENPFVDYGYYKTYIYLNKMARISISKHLVYRLMQKSNLLRKQYQITSKKHKRQFVKDLLPLTQEPFAYLEIDIKFIWVKGKKRNAQLMTVLDVFSRYNLAHFIDFSIRETHLIQLFEKVLKLPFLPDQISLRNDNGSQFVALNVQAYFKDKVKQEFTKPATPEQNAHIEAYHSIVESAICQRFEFEDLPTLKTTLDQFRHFYNFERIHGGIGFQSPVEYLQKCSFNTDWLE